MSSHTIGSRKKMNPPSPRNTWRGWFRYFQYNKATDSPSEARNVLLVVAALIAAVTFQSGVNPPGGVWQDNDGHHAGRAIYASQPHAFYAFLVSNTLALSSSLLVIVSLTYRFPLHFGICFNDCYLCVCYFLLLPLRENVKFRYILIPAALPLIMRIFVRTFKKLKTYHWH